MVNWNEQLFDSVQSNNLPKVLEALENGAGIGYTNQNDNALTYAINNNLTEIAEAIIGHGVDLNLRNGNGDTALHVAVEGNKNGLALRLLDAGAEVNATSRSGGNALYRAVLFGNEEMAIRLIEMGADIHAGVRGSTPLLESVYAGSAGITKALLEAGADVKVIDAEGAVALGIASKKGDAESVALLLKHGADPYKADSYGLQTLHQAALNGHVDVAKALLDWGVDVNDVSQYKGNTALHFATQSSNPQLVELLIASGADTEIRNEAGDTTLLHASGYESPEAVESLIAGGADVNAQDKKSSQTALNRAALLGSGKTIRTLLAGGADPNITDSIGDTALIHALRANKSGSVKSIVTDLLAKGAHPNVLNQLGSTPESIAKNYSDKEVVKLLRSARRGKGPSEASVDFTPELIDLAASRERIADIAAGRSSGITPVVAELASPEAAAEPAIFQQPKAVLGEHTRRVVDALSPQRAENDALESILTRVVDDKFVAELAYRNGFGAEQIGSLDDARVEVSRRYRTGPEPKWKVDLSVGANVGDLHDVVGDIAEELQAAALDVKTSEMGRRKTITIDFHNNLDQVVDALNSVFSDAIGKIDMSELRAAAKATAQQAAKPQDLGRGA